MVFDISYPESLIWDYGTVTNIITRCNPIRTYFPYVDFKHRVLLFSYLPCVYFTLTHCTFNAKGS